MTTDSAPLRGLLDKDPVVATSGVALFAEELRAQAVPVTEVAWHPVAEPDRQSLATVMADRRRTEANAHAVARMAAAQAHLVDVVPASTALGLERGTFLHAGPPITWDRASGPLRGALIGAVLFEGLALTPEEAEQQLAAGFQITSIPTLMVFRENVIVFSQAGALPAPQLEQLIEGIRGLDMNEVRAQIAAQDAGERSDGAQV